ncbi:hypothetical protein ACFPOE_07595 [Caenimonas terrae]|uniref:Uncharacterized protein n=1 Tax=Caenimonas terrae TaxID=696074 RepID=A0ABW0NDS3_9BURK
MENQRVETMKRVQESFAEWKAVQDRIKQLEAALQAHDATRDAPLAQLQRDLLSLKNESERLLLAAQYALLSIKTPRSSSGDSTWG